MRSVLFAALLAFLGAFGCGDGGNGGGNGDGNGDGANDGEGDGANDGEGDGGVVRCDPGYENWRGSCVATCELTRSSDCPSGSACHFVQDVTGWTAFLCMPEGFGTGAEGDVCSQSRPCGAGLVCLSLPWYAARCFRACGPAAPCSTGACVTWTNWPYPRVCEHQGGVGEYCTWVLGGGVPPAQCQEGLRCLQLAGDQYPMCYQLGGGLGELCRTESPACDQRLACVDATTGVPAPPDPAAWSHTRPPICVPAGAEGQTCPSDGSCDSDLVCGRSYSCYDPHAAVNYWPCCTPAGGWYQPCFGDKSCLTGLFCVQDKCSYTYAHECCIPYGSCTTVGARCYGDPGGETYCTDPSPNTCFEGTTPCCLRYSNPPGHACTTDSQCGAQGRCLAAPVVSCEHGAAACCVPAAGPGELCDWQGQCVAGLACATQPAGTCPYGKDSCCAVAAACGPSDTCDAGLACVAAGTACPSGQTKCCLPVGGPNEACGAGQTCNAGLGCLAAGVGTGTWCQNLTECCLAAGGDAQPCVPGTPPTCGVGLACVSAQNTGACPDYHGATECCTQAGGLNQPCYVDGTCDASLSCVADLACPAWLAKCCR